MIQYLTNNRRRIFILGFLLLLLVPSMNLIVHQSVWAEEADDVGGEEELNEESFNQLFEQPRSDNPLVLLAQLIFYTILVIVLIYGLVKFLAIRQRKLQHNQVFQPLGGTPLGPNKSLQLMKVGGKIYLLGVAEQITLIKEIADPEDIVFIQRELEERESVISRGIFEPLVSRLRGEDREQTKKQSFQQLFKQSMKYQQKNREQVEEQLSTKTDAKEGRF